MAPRFNVDQISNKIQINIALTYYSNGNFFFPFAKKKIYINKNRPSKMKDNKKKYFLIASTMIWFTICINIGNGKFLWFQISHFYGILWEYDHVQGRQDIVFIFETYLSIKFSSIEKQQKKKSILYAYFIGLVKTRQNRQN